MWTSDAQNASVRPIHKFRNNIAVQNICVLLCKVDIVCVSSRRERRPRQKHRFLLCRMAIRRAIRRRRHGGRAGPCLPKQGSIKREPFAELWEPDIPTNPKLNKQTYNAQTIKHSTTEPQTSYRRGTNPTMAAYTTYCNTFSHILTYIAASAAHTLYAAFLPPTCRPSVAICDSSADHLPPVHCPSAAHLLTIRHPICRPSATFCRRLQPICRPCTAIRRPSAAFCDAAFSLFKTCAFYGAKSTSDAQNASVRQIHKGLRKIAVQNMCFFTV